MFWDGCDINGFLTSILVDLSPKDQPVSRQGSVPLNLANYKGISPFKVQYLMHKTRICLHISYPAPLRICRGNSVVERCPL